MKNQYYGDINDYRKYGLLRCLAREGLSIGICWMLTERDESTDGVKTEYLSKPQKWQFFDPMLFDCLYYDVKVSEKRAVAQVEFNHLFTNSTFFNEHVPIVRLDRDKYISRALDTLGNVDLVFFDPDNGFEVSTTRYDSKDSTKYVFWSEAASVYLQGHSMLVYQHYPRENRDLFHTRLYNAVLEHMPSAKVFIFRAASVAFVLMVRPEHSCQISQAVQRVITQWKSQIVQVK